MKLEVTPKAQQWFKEDRVQPETGIRFSEKFTEKHLFMMVFHCDVCRSAR